MTNLTPQQSAIISAFKSGESMAIRSVAGSGKTTTLVECFQHAPSSSLSVAFNKRNAEDLASKMPSHVVSKTMNALGHAAWIGHIGKYPKVEADKLFKLLKSAPDYSEIRENTSEILQLVRLAKSFGIKSGWNTGKLDKDFWLDIADEYDIEDAENLLPYAEWLLIESCKQAFQGLIDFDDQIYMPITYGSPFKKFSCVAVDEAQDLSSMQHEMVRKSLAPGGQLIVVGDPNQAIYAWRGASSNSFQDLIEKFSLSLRNLTVSFRCPRNIVEEAKKYVPDIEAASDMQGSVTSLTVPIEPQPGIAVISRTNAPLIRLAFKSLRKRQAVAYTGKDFLTGLKALNKKYPTIASLEKWKASELAKTDKAAKRVRIEDKFFAMQALHESGNVVQAIEQLTRTPPGQALTLSTIHKAKGLEWEHVVYLDYAKEWKGNQESNIKYVGVTRAKQSLVLHEENSPSW